MLLWNNNNNNITITTTITQEVNYAGRRVYVHIVIILVVNSWLVERTNEPHLLHAPAAMDRIFIPSHACMIDWLIDWLPFNSIQFSECFGRTCTPRQPVSSWWPSRIYICGRRLFYFSAVVCEYNTCYSTAGSSAMHARLCLLSSTRTDGRTDGYLLWLPALSMKLRLLLLYWIAMAGRQGRSIGTTIIICANNQLSKQIINELYDRH